MHGGELFVACSFVMNLALNLGQACPIRLKLNSAKSSVAHLLAYLVGRGTVDGEERPGGLLRQLSPLVFPRMLGEFVYVHSQQRLVGC